MSWMSQNIFDWEPEMTIEYQYVNFSQNASKTEKALPCFIMPNNVVLMLSLVNSQ